MKMKFLRLLFAIERSWNVMIELVHVLVTIVVFRINFVGFSFVLISCSNQTTSTCTITAIACTASKCYHHLTMQHCLFIYLHNLHPNFDPLLLPDRTHRCGALFQLHRFHLFLLFFLSFLFLSSFSNLILQLIQNVSSIKS